MTIVFARRVSPLLAVILLQGCTGIDPGYLSNRGMDTGDFEGCDSAQFDVTPKLVSGNTPHYPLSQALKNETGKGVAVVRFTIGVDGKTANVKAETKDYEYFAHNLAAAVQGWKFIPATRMGKPVATDCGMRWHYGGS